MKKEEWNSMLEELSKPRPLQKIHAPQAAMIAMSDKEFIEVWNNGGETKYIIFDQPSGRVMFDKLQDRAKNLNLIP